MGWMDKAMRTAQAVGQQASAALEQASAREDGVGGALRKSKQLGESAAAAANDALGEFAQTDRGQRTGAAIRRVQDEASRLPGVTVISDSFRSAHGIDVLAQRLRDDPAEPWHHLWLGEAIGRQTRGQNRFTAARAVFDPSVVLTKTATRAAGRVANDGETLETRLLKRAYVTSLRRLHSDLRDHDAWHIVSRVYLAREQPASAKSAATVAALLAPGDGRVLTTLADAQSRLLEYVAAAGSADAGIAAGCSMGYRVKAQLVSQTASGTLKARAAAVAASEELLAMVKDADLEAYQGFVRDLGDAARRVAASQRDKAQTAGARLQNIPRQPTGAM